MTAALFLAVSLGCATATLPAECGDAKLDRFWLQPIKVEVTSDPATGVTTCTASITTTGVDWIGIIGALLAIGVSL